MLPKKWVVIAYRDGEIKKVFGPWDNSEWAKNFAYNREWETGTMHGVFPMTSPTNEES